MTIKAIRTKSSHTGNQYDMTFSYAVSGGDISPITLPTSYPATDTWSFTVTQSFLDSCVTGNLYNPFLIFCLIAGGDTGTGTPSLYYYFYKNSVQIGSSKNAGGSAYHSCYLYASGCAVGDVFSIKAYCSSGNATINYIGYTIQGGSTGKYGAKDFTIERYSDTTPRPAWTTTLSPVLSETGACSLQSPYASTSRGISLNWGNISTGSITFNYTPISILNYSGNSDFFCLSNPYPYGSGSSTNKLKIGQDKWMPQRVKFRLLKNR